MSMTDITSGARLSTQTQLIDAINSQRKFALSSKLEELVTSETPFISLIRKIKRFSMDDPEKQFYEHRSAFLNTAVGYWKTGGGTDVGAATHLGASVTQYISTTVGGSSYSSMVKAGDIVQVVDSDDTSLVANLLLVSVSTNKWTAYCLTEAPGFTPSTSDIVYLVGSAHGEDGAFTTAMYDKAQTRWFTSQIFKDQVSFSRTLEKMKSVIYGSEADRLLREGLKYHQVKIDRALLWGSSRQTAISSSGTTNPFLAPYNEMVDADSKVIRTSASFLQVMNATSNRDVSLITQVHNVTMADYEFADLVDDMEIQFTHGSDVKEAICGRGVLSFFNKLAMKDSTYQIKAAENAYGMKVQKLITPHGELNLMPSKGMSEAGYNYAMAVIDPAHIGIGEFDPTAWYGLPKTRDGKDIEILTDCGLMVGMPETHGWWWFK